MIHESNMTKKYIIIQEICLCIHFIPLQVVRFCVSNYKERRSKLAAGHEVKKKYIFKCKQDI